MNCIKRKTQKNDINRATNFNKFHEHVRFMIVDQKKFSIFQIDSLKMKNFFQLNEIDFVVDLFV